MKRTTIGMLAALLVAALPFSAYAADDGTTPFQFSFFNVNAPEGDVVGVHLSTIYGKTGNVTGWEWPLLAFSDTASMKGLSFSPFLVSANRVRGDMTGVTLGVFTVQEGQSTGVNLNAVNITNNVNGLNWSFANISSGYTVADVGFLNISKKSNFQFSAVNITDQLEGLQIGLLNCAKNGFLPCFVFFNFGSAN
ncbi:MAG: phaC PHA synthase [Gammaproteobacteria bacterium]|jgi:hypothetical protein